MMYIGIDPGVNTGVAIWKDCQFESLLTLKIHKAMDLVRNLKPDLVRVEDARKRKWYPKGANLQGAGSVKRDSKIWEDFLKDLNYNFEMVHPLRDVWDTHEKFERITGYKKRTSKHSRDAALLVYKMGC